MASTSTAITRLGTGTTPAPGASRIYYIDEGQHLRCILCTRGPDGKYRPTGVEERISFPIVQAVIAKQMGRPDLHPTELGFSELGAGKFARKIKRAAKKVGQSKILQKVAKGIKTVAAFVPGASAVTASIDAGTMAAKGIKGARKLVRGARSALSGYGDVMDDRVVEVGALTGIPVSEMGAIKARLPAGAIAAASAQLRSAVKPTSAVATTTKQALLREGRLSEASKSLALVPANKRAAAAKVIANRVDGYKVLTPKGNTVWVPASVARGGAAA